MLLPRQLLISFKVYASRGSSTSTYSHFLFNWLGFLKIIIFAGDNSFAKNIFEKPSVNLRFIIKEIDKISKFIYSSKSSSKSDIDDFICFLNEEYYRKGRCFLMTFTYCFVSLSLSHSFLSQN